MPTKFYKLTDKINRRQSRDEGEYNQPLVRENLLPRDGHLKSPLGTQPKCEDITDIATWMARYYTIEVGAISPKTFAYSQDGKIWLMDYKKEDITEVVITVYPKKEVDYMEYASDALAQATYVTDSPDAESVDQQNVAGADDLNLGDVGGSEARWGQSFILSGAKTVSAVEVKRGSIDSGTPSGNWTLRIETDNAGKPSGVLADVNASVVVTPPAFNTIIKGTFATPFALSAATSYWLVINCDNQPDNNDFKLLGAFGTGAYANGLALQSVAGIWGVDTGTDLYFKVYAQATGALQSYSENSIVSQGTYSLKAVAAITASVNKTLTRTISPVLDLANYVTLNFDIYSSRTGSNIKIGILDSGSTLTEITPNITAANAWQTVTWDVSGVVNTDKDGIYQIIITIVDASVANTFYIDNFFAQVRTVTANSFLGVKYTPSVGDCAVVKDNLNPEAYPNSWMFKTATQMTMYFVDGLNLYSYNGNNDNIFEQVTFQDSEGNPLKPIDLIEHRDRNCVITNTSLLISKNLEPSVFDDATDSIEIIIGSGKGKNLGIAKINEYLYILNTEGIFVLYGDTISALAPTFEVKLMDERKICAFRSRQKVERSIIFLGANDKNIELWSFDGTSCKMLSYLEKLTDYIHPAPQMLQKACSTYFNNYYMISVVETGSTFNNIEFWYDTFEDKIDIIRGRNVSCYMNTDPTIEPSFQLLGRSDANKIMWADRGRNFDGLPIVRRLRSRDITPSIGENVRFTAFYPKIEPTGNRDIYFRYLLDGRESDLDHTADFYQNLEGENMPLGLIKFNNQGQFTGRVRPKINYARGTSIAIEIYDATIDMEFQMTGFGIEFIGKGKKKGKKVGQ